MIEDLPNKHPRHDLQVIYTFYLESYIGGAGAGAGAGAAAVLGGWFHSRMKETK